MSALLTKKTCFRFTHAVNVKSKSRKKKKQKVRSAVNRVLLNDWINDEMRFKAEVYKK